MPNAPALPPALPKCPGHDPPALLIMPLLLPPDDAPAAALRHARPFPLRQVVKHSLAHGSPIELSMTPTQATIFFLDIESFTRLTETTHTRYLVDNLTLFFERLSNIIVQHRGFIDKYIGDSIMAIWNTPDRLLDHEFQACRAALECLEAAKTPHPGMLLLRARVGMETGPVYAGIFGSLHRMNYTVVGTRCRGRDG